LFSGPKSTALEEVIAEELRADSSWQLLSVGSSLSRLIGGNGGDSTGLSDAVQPIAKGITQALPAAGEGTYDYLSQALQLRPTVEGAMLSMSSAKFEKVLHPIFQEDEATLVAVGTALGAATGFAQVPFY
jgi:hypothetical protein